MDILEQKIRISKIFKNTLCGLKSRSKSNLQKIYRNYPSEVEWTKWLKEYLKGIKLRHTVQD